MKELILISGATSGLGLEFANLCLGNSKEISISLLEKEFEDYSKKIRVLL